MLSGPPRVFARVQWELLCRDSCPSPSHRRLRASDSCIDILELFSLHSLPSTSFLLRTEHAEKYKLANPKFVIYKREHYEEKTRRLYGCIAIFPRNIEYCSWISRTVLDIVSEKGLHDSLVRYSTS